MNVFESSLARLQQALRPWLTLSTPTLDAQRHFWRIGNVGDVVVDVADPGFPTGVAPETVSYVADRGAAILIVRPDDPRVVTTFPDLLEEIAGHRQFQENHAAFARLLPSLLNDEQIHGKWVIFFDKKISHVADTRDDVYAWFRQNMKALSGPVIAQIVEPRSYRVGGARREKR